MNTEMKFAPPKGRDSSPGSPSANNPSATSWSDSNRIYFDHNATTPLSPKVRLALPDWIDQFGNPSSIHWGGRGPKNIIRNSRTQVAELIGCDPLEVIFTGSASEANNHALKGFFFKNTSEKNHYLVGGLEHPSVMRTAQFLMEQGAQVEFYRVPNSGLIDLDDFESRLKPTTVLVSFMLANNETGTVFPIKKMAKLAHKVGAVFHCDGVQALGKIAVNVRDLGVDLASFAGHKFYSLKGCGVLYQRRGLTLESLIHGGGHERNRRAGTENVLAIAALGLMAQEKGHIIAKSQKLLQLRDHFEATMKNVLPGIRINGETAPRLPNTSSLIIDGVDGDILLMNLDMQGVAVSTGAACSSGSPEPSPVLLALGLSRREAQSSLRVSFGWENTLQETQSFIEILVATVEKLRKQDVDVRAKQ